MASFVDDGVGAAFLECCQCKLVAVERCPSQSQEDAALRTVARIGSDARVLLVEFIDFFDVHCFGDFGCKVIKYFLTHNPYFLFYS